MKILLDECVDRRIARLLHGHNVSTAQQMGWAGAQNGRLMQLATDNSFQLLITVDRNLAFQQGHFKPPIAVAILAARSNRLADLRPLVPELLLRIANLASGDVLTIPG